MPGSVKKVILRGVEFFRFDLRESSRGSSIGKGASIFNTAPFPMDEPRGFDAVKTKKLNAPQYNKEAA